MNKPNTIRLEPEALSQMSPRQLLGLIAAGALTWRTGICAGCGHEYRDGEQHVMGGVWVFNEGAALYTLCTSCAPRARKQKFRQRIRSYAYRSLFKSGPDDVEGSA